MAQIFDLFNFNLMGVLFFLGALVSISIGAIVLVKNPHSNVNRSFFLITLAGTIWLFSYSVIVQAANENLAHAILKFNYFFSVPYISPCVYLFSINFSGQKENKLTIRFAFISALIIAIVLLFKLDVLWSLQKFPWGYFNHINANSTAKILFSILMIHFTTFAFLSFRNLYLGYASAKSPQERRHKFFFLIGALIGYTGSLDFAVTLGLKMRPLGPFSFALFCLIIAYGILRYQMFDVRLVLKKLTIVLSIYSVLSLLIIPTAFFALTRLISKPSFNPFNTVFAMSISLGMIFSIGPFIYAYLVRHTVWLRGTLATGLTHELKSPLGVLQSTVDVLKEQLTAGKIDSPKTAEYLEMAQKNLARLETTVKGLLDVAKIQEENITIEKKEFDIASTVGFILETQVPLAEKKNLQIFYSGPNSLRIIGDKEKLEQTVSNIISNALKFSDNGTINVSLSESNGQIQFSVKDQGAGLNSKDLTKVFDRFYQAHPNSKGSGIGLTIAKAWVEAHGGKIWVESDGEGKGTRVSFSLPMN